VNDSNKKVIMRYDVQRDGTVTNGRLFADMNAGKGAGNPDGMKFDVKGNLYSVGPAASGSSIRRASRLG
jgi:gluconolactonase